MSKVSTKSTKQELVKAYNDLLKQYKSLESAGGGASVSHSGGGGDSSDDDGDDVDISGIIGGLTALRARFGDAARSLQQQLVAEASALGELRAGIDANTRHLAELHGITADDDTLGQLLRAYRDTAKAGEQEFAAKKAALDVALEARRAAWKKEQAEHSQRLKEAKEAGERARKREAAEYDYELKQRRQADQDALAQADKAAAAELTLLREAHAVAVAEREKSVEGREKEWSELRAKRDAHPAALEAVSKRAEDEGRGIARQQAKTAADLLAKDNDGKRRVYELKIASLDQTIKKQVGQIDNLNKQLATAIKQAQDLAVKAIEGASNSTSFDAIREIAMEQAKFSAKGK
ncbi:MAG: hypothetical protein IPK80_09755 [Nannocystis sp.]|nr:hypothetical protein [Nannocystis sp.]